MTWMCGLLCIDGEHKTPMSTLTRSQFFIAVTHEFKFVIGMLEYVQARLSAASTIDVARQSRRLHVLDGGVGCFLNLHCGHNSAFEKDEKAQLQELIESATAAQAVGAVQQIV